ncbi:MAG: glucosaminidase domain-containing protein [Treponema sp.]|jgi:hypothetical protein|nr:glucosaminidase domain-containing protein [Treponema sp.]
MNKYLYTLIAVLIIFASCAGVKPGVKPGTELKKPEPPTHIMGEGQVGADKMALFLVQNNSRLQMNFALQFARLYIEEASFEGVNHDIAFTQMCLETGFLAFGNLVTPDQNNFAGLGATGLPGPDGVLEKGLYFPDLRTGVRAHIQHLKAYASTDDLNLTLVNPRRRFVRLGSSPTIEGLAGTWAADRQYAEKINAMLKRLYELAF